MLSFSRTVSSAILALSCLSRCGKSYYRSLDISRCTGVPQTNVARIMHLLRQAGIVEARRGVGGGFTMARPPERISVLEIIRAVDQNLENRRCLLGLPRGPEDRCCPLQDMWVEETARIEKRLAKLTLAETASFMLARKRLHPVHKEAKSSR